MTNLQAPVIENVVPLPEQDVVEQMIEDKLGFHEMSQEPSHRRNQPFGLP